MTLKFRKKKKKNNSPQAKVRTHLEKHMVLLKILYIRVLLTYTLRTYIRKPFKTTFYEKVINYFTVFSNPHKTISKNGWLIYVFRPYINWTHIFILL